MDTGTSLSERLIAAALEAAEQGAWEGASVADLADRAGMPKADAEATFPSVGAVLDAFARQMDERMLGELDPDELANVSPRERLLEALMCRLDALVPHRVALKVFGREARYCPAAATRMSRRAHVSMGNVLDVTGLAGSELQRNLRSMILAYVWLRACRQWLLEGGEKSIDSMMATLDQDLGRLETLAGCFRGFGTSSDA